MFYFNDNFRNIAQWVLAFTVVGKERESCNTIADTGRDQVNRDLCTVNVDNFACIHFRGFKKMGNFACVKIRVFSTNNSLGYNDSNFQCIYFCGYLRNAN